MPSCSRCGAAIDPSALECPYCRTQTQYGRQHAAAQAAYQQQAAHAEEQRRTAEQQQRHAALRKKAQHALFWALGGTLLCCFPAALVGLVMGLNVKQTAKREGIIAPGASTAAVVLGCLAVLLFMGGVALYIRDSRARDARLAALEAQIAAGHARAELDQPLACALVEFELLQEGFAGTGGINISDFRCDGKLEPGRDSAVLRDVRFRTSSSERHTIAACLSRGERWSVQVLSADGHCGTAALGSSAASSTAPVTVPSAP